MLDADLQKRILKTLEAEGSLSLSQLVEEVEMDESVVDDAVSELVERNLVVVHDVGDENKLESEPPVPISELAFRGELTPTQAVVRYLYEEQGYGQSEIARMLNYSPGNIQTNLNRLEQKLGREIEQDR